ncbi:MAG: hypothetical protein AAB955_04070 [Patescibacteria group bacterium]
MYTKTVKGAFTIEILIAFTVVTLALSGAVMVALGGQVSGMDMNLSGGGLHREMSLYERNVAQAYSSWAGLTSVAASDPNDDLGYSTSTTVAYVSPCIKEVSSSVSWSSDKSRTLGAAVTMLAGSVAEARALGGGCDPLPPLSGWENPDSFGSIDVSGADGTGVVARSVAGHRYVFLTADPSAAAKEDLYIFNVDDAQSPSLTGSLNTGKGLNDIVVAGQYAYVVQNDNVDQLQVVDISTPSAPVVVATASLPGVVSTGSYPEGRSIAYSNNRLYIGTNETAGPEFHIFDVTTPTAPASLGSLEVTHNVHDIAVRSSTAYLATSADYGELVLIDVSTPASLSLPPNFSTPDTMDKKFNARTHTGTPTESTENGTTLDVVGTRVYLGRERASNANERDLYIIDVSTQSALTELGSLRIGIGSNTEVSGIISQGTYAFVMSTDSNSPFQVIDTTDPSAMFVQSSCGFNFSQVTRAISYLDNFIFSANRSNDILRIIYDKPGTSCS